MNATKDSNYYKDILIIDKDNNMVILDHSKMVERYNEFSSDDEVCNSKTFQDLEKYGAEFLADGQLAKTEKTYEALDKLYYNLSVGRFIKETNKKLGWD